MQAARRVLPKRAATPQRPSSSPTPSASHNDNPTTNSGYTPASNAFRLPYVDDPDLMRLEPDHNLELTERFFSSTQLFADGSTTEQGTDRTNENAPAAQAGAPSSSTAASARKRTRNQLELPRFNEAPLDLLPSKQNENSHYQQCFFDDDNLVSDDVIDECMMIPAIDVTAALRYVMVPRYFTYHMSAAQKSPNPTIEPPFDSQMNPADVLVPVKLFNKDTDLTKRILLHAHAGFSPMMTVHIAQELSDGIRRDSSTSDDETDDGEGYNKAAVNLAKAVNLQHEIVALSLHVISFLLRDERTCGYALQVDDYAPYGVAIRVIVPDFSTPLSMSTMDGADTSGNQGSMDPNTDLPARRKVLHLTVINDVNQLPNVYRLLSCLLTAAQSTNPLGSCLSIITANDFPDARAQTPLALAVGYELKRELMRSIPRPQQTITPYVDLPYPNRTNGIRSLVEQFGLRLNVHAYDIECECATMAEEFEDIGFMTQSGPHVKWSTFINSWAPFYTRFISTYRFSICIAAAICVDSIDEDHLHSVDITCPFAMSMNNPTRAELTHKRTSLNLTFGCNDAMEEEEFASEDDCEDDDDGIDMESGNLMHLAADVVSHLRQYVSLRDVLLRAATSPTSNNI